MAKRMTLDETWKNCLSMWRWIAGEIKKTGQENFALCDSPPVFGLKRRWLEDNGFFEVIFNDCFFCEAAGRSSRDDGFPECRNCPCVAVDDDFECEDTEYDFADHPIAFYNKLVSLDRKRKLGIKSKKVPK